MEKIYCVTLAVGEGFCSTEALALQIASSPERVEAIEVWESKGDLPPSVRALVEEKEKAARKETIFIFRNFLNSLPAEERAAAIKKVTELSNDFEDDIPF